MTVNVATQPATQTRARSRRWPAAIVAMIALHAAGMVSVILIATRDPSFSVEPNHYQKALAWDAFSARERESQALGWKVEAKTDTALANDRTRGVECRISDRNGAAVTGATVALLAFAHARGDERLRVDLTESAPGVYRARAPLVRTGIWEWRVVVQRGNDHFTTTLLHTVEDSP